MVASKFNAAAPVPDARWIECRDKSAKRRAARDVDALQLRIFDKLFLLTFKFIESHR